MWNGKMKGLFRLGQKCSLSKLCVFSNIDLEQIASSALHYLLYTLLLQ